MRYRHWSQVELDGFEPPKLGDKEGRDCAVWALGSVGKLSYPEALDCCRKWGRKKPRTGTATEVMLTDLKFKLAMFHRGWIVRKVDLGKCKTVQAFARSHPRGRFILKVKQHVAPLIDGLFVDYKPGGRRHLGWAYEFHPVGAEPAKQGRPTFNGKHPVTLVREAILSGGWEEGQRVAKELGVTHKLKKWLREGVIPRV